LDTRLHSVSQNHRKRAARLLTLLGQALDPRHDLLPTSCSASGLGVHDVDRLAGIDLLRPADLIGTQDIDVGNLLDDLLEFLLLLRVIPQGFAIISTTALGFMRVTLPIERTLSWPQRSGQVVLDLMTATLLDVGIDVGESLARPGFQNRSKYKL
jgi:hypothetical protein